LALINWQEDGKVIVLNTVSFQSQRSMDKWVPECKSLKTIYDDCMQDWYENKLTSLAVTNSHPCNEKFADYKDCVTIGMKLINEKKRVKKDM
jgi:hypothetical protein